ncbi:BEACH domain-containing protein C2 isoform X1 [Physcomitrium patens]|uniref:BEACH domain-containing protein n=1 Tax=Physcomitrium patens TaxID=3218 RepID=A0A2K1J8K3_PHYPA|nr:BEACH domain-containing protein C2-like [Physcomitrium patens]XP_024399025.1 BEACH domain-containing protein C2-like [Physcomitrium patens]XP_024399026.1 BEACH domain-containing protein C2-like [Physcomitrium patens]XP_024399028.1 BEACH domain-containing protein C2-like [Physcomitrium patens]PNR37862.1 hypothetical protein PHYPA_020971 [Physcomitrium patens]|eukprot:XP_024399024.1 BEACH domain-containing protein C2-like [Physcomitrella patens]
MMNNMENSGVGSGPDHHNSEAVPTNRFGTREKPSSLLEEPILEDLSSFRDESGSQVPPSTSEKLLSIAGEMIPEESPSILEEPSSTAEEPNSVELPSITELPRRSPEKENSVLGMHTMAEIVLNQVDELNGGLASFRSLDLGPTEPGVVVGIRPAHSVDSSHTFSAPKHNLPSLKEFTSMLKVSPELMSLVDSAIRGSDRASLVKLKRVIGGEEVFGTRDGDGDAKLARYVVDTLIAKMGGADGLDKAGGVSTPRMMLSAGAAVVAGELLPWIPCEDDDKTIVSPRTRMAKALSLILQACTRNRAMCSAAGLLRVLLVAYQRIVMGTVGRRKGSESWDTGSLLDAIEALGSHCLSVKHLREWLNAAGNISSTGKSTSLDLLHTLERTMSGEETRGPAHSFEFDGESSGLLSPGESKWPFLNGYAFATWLYIESFADTVDTAAAAAAIASAAAAKSGNSSAMSAASAVSALASEGTAHMPRFFSFLSVDNLGVEAYFHGQFLVVESIHGKGKKASLYFTHAFKPKRWYFVGLEHMHKKSLLGKAEDEMRLYVDGPLYESRPLVFPRISRGLSFCCIGTNPSRVIVGLQKRRRQCPLFAEMGPVYIFKEPLGQKKMLQLALRGGDALPTFGAGAGARWLANNEQSPTTAEESAALDLELGPRLHLLYHPKLLNGRSCPDASPAGASGACKKPAEVLGHIYIAARVRPTESVWAVGEGGPMALLPLAVGAVDKDSMQPVIKGEVSSSSALLAAPILRILALGLKYTGSAEEFARIHADRLLANLLGYLVRVPAFVGLEKKVDEQAKTEERDEELVAAVVSLSQAPQCHISLKVQLFRSLLLDLKLWGSCSYGLQKKLLSTLSDMVYSEAATMRGANAVQMLLDGCRCCYWLNPEPNSLFTFSVEKSSRHAGELNALVDELLVVVELLVGSAQGRALSDDVCSLVQFVLDCPQPNQVARVLHLMYRLVVQPNSTKAATFADTFLANGGVEMLFTLLRREAESGEGLSNRSTKDADPEMKGPCDDEQITNDQDIVEVPSDVNADYEVMNSTRKMQEISIFPSPESAGTFDGTIGISENDLRLSLSTKTVGSVARSRSAAHKTSTVGTLGGISSSIIADSVRNKFRNMDFSDGIMVGIVTLLGSLVSGGHLKVMRFGMEISQPPPSSAGPGVSSSGEGTTGVAAAAVVWLLFALEKAFQSAPRKLLTVNVYAALLPAVIRSEKGLLLADDRLAFYDAGHQFENIPLLLVLLRSLPLAPVQLQLRVLQDMLLLACTHPENRKLLTTMPEWPEWLLEILLSNYEATGMGSSEGNDKSEETEDLVYSFLTIMLEHSLRLKDGWKDVEATIHCAEWLTLSGELSTGERRLKREVYLPVIKRKIFCSLLSFASNELQLQTQVVAAAAAGVAAGGLSPRTAKAETETVASLSVSLSENALVLLMLVEDHLRLEAQAYQKTLLTKSEAPERSTYTISRGSLGGSMESFGSRSFALSSDSLEPSLEKSPSRRSSNSEMDNMSLEALATTSDGNGKISATAVERLTASVAAEPYESVRCAFACYGSYGLELAQGWKRRSRMWYGVGLPPRNCLLGGGGGGFKAWSSGLEKDDDGQWIELPLVKKAITMLKALLLDQYSPGTGVGGIFVPGTAGSGSWGLQLPQLLDSDQPFFAMLRITLLALREEDQGEPIFEGGSTEHDKNIETVLPSMRRRSKTSSGQWNFGSDYFQEIATSNARGSLLWCVLAPLLTRQLFESRRQRVLVACCILYSEMWHSVSEDRDVLRQGYMETIIPPFAALLRRWRPLLSGIHELTDAQGQSPLAVEYHHLASDMHPLEAGLAMISPGWAAAFASPPAAMALAMAAAGVGGGEGSHRRRNSESDRSSPKLLSFPTFSKAPDRVEVPQTPVDIAASKAAALAAARDQDRAARVGSGRGLGAVAMATAGQRRSLTDKERAERRNIWETMGSMWLDCDSVGNSAANNASGHPHRMFGMISSMSEKAHKMRSAEEDRRATIAATDEFDSTLGDRAWRSLLRRLQEIDALIGTFCNQLGPSRRILWKLDSTENSLRMRLRLKQSYKGTDHHGAAVDHQESGKSFLPQSLGSTPFPGGGPKIAPEKDALEESNEEDLREKKQDLEERSGEMDKDPASETVVEDSMSDVSVPSQVTNATTVSEVAAAMSTEYKEKLILEIPAAMVLPLKVLRGRFQVTTKRVCFMIDDRVYINKSGVPSVLEEEDDWEMVDGGAEEHHDGRDQQRKDGAKDRLWPLSLLREVHSRRFSLKRSALELFMVDRSNFFFNFGTMDARQRVYKAIVQAKPPYLDIVYARTQGPQQLLNRTNLTERWARREITNFEYLMQLNTLAGRTYNDITQYPVFPWVLADYTSEELNLDDPNLYRDLSKPVGALNPARLEKFLERYDNFDDPVIPKFHYHSHYSSAGTVLYYLVRVEPYTSLAIQFQGGKFDHADRMFSDIGSTWNGVLEDMSDVKELIPELFYLPEALKNGNCIDLGRTQKGDKLGDVKLPPWASSPEDFIYKHRSALESEYVSEHLNEWIDLIFGCKQRGQAAISANNVFFYMAYEGAVDIDKFTDPILRKATHEQSAYFGQTPSQLLTIPHVKRMPLADVLHLQTIFRNPNSSKAYAIPSPDRLNLPAKELRTTHDSIITVDMEAPACHVAVQKWQPNTPDGRGMPFLFHHGRSKIEPSSGLMRMFSRPTDDEENRFPRAVALPPAGVKLGSIVAITPDGHFLLTGGHADNSVKLVATDTAHAVGSTSSHCAPVTCLALSSDGSILVTGSQDSTALLWRFHGSSATSTGAGSTGMSDPSLVAAAAGASNLEEGNITAESRRPSLEGPLHVLRGHVDELVSCCVNADLDLVVTFSSSKGVLLHSITKGRFLRRLSVDRADLVALSPEGIIVVFDKATRVLQSFTVNGTLMTAKLLPSWEGNISSIVISKDGLHAVVGTSCLLPDGSRPPPRQTAVDSKSERYGGQHSPKWSMVGACPSCGGKSKMHSVNCKLSRGNQQPLFQGNQHPGFDALPRSPSGYPRSDSTIVMRRSESGLIRYSSSNVRRSNEAGGLGSGDGGISTEFQQKQQIEPQPAIILLELRTLEVIQKFMLRRGQDITAMALNNDDTNLVVSTAKKHLIVFTDPSLSMKVANQMLRMGSEGGGLAGYI